MKDDFGNKDSLEKSPKKLKLKAKATTMSVDKKSPKSPKKLSRSSGVIKLLGVKKKIDLAKKAIDKFKLHGTITSEIEADDDDN